MKVKELIAELQKLDPEQNVLAICDDEDLNSNNNGLEVFWVDSVSKVKATGSRVDVGEVSFKFGDGPDARDHVFIHLDYKF